MYKVKDFKEVAGPKFGIYGTPVTHAGLMIAQAPENVILLGPTSRSLLPGMYKVKDFKEVAGVGLAHQLLDREGRKPVADRDIHALAPVKKTEAGGDKGGDAKEEGVGGGDAGGDTSAAPAPASAAGGDDVPSGGGGDSGGTEQSGGGGGGDDGGDAAVGDGDGETKM